MYQDTQRIRHIRVGINLDEYEARLIDAYVDYTGLPRAQVLRQLAMNAARTALANGFSVDEQVEGSEVQVCAK